MIMTLKGSGDGCACLCAREGTDIITNRCGHYVFLQLAYVFIFCPIVIVLVSVDFVLYVETGQVPTSPPAHARLQIFGTKKREGRCV